MTFTTNGDSAFLAAFAIAQEYRVHAEDAPPALLLEQALWGDDDDENDVDGEEGDELMANDDELLMIPELLASDDTQSDSASAPPTDHTQYPQMQVASLPNRRNLARRSRKKMFKYKPNRARDGRREELVYLSKKVSELEAQLETLKRRQSLNNTNESEFATLQQPQRDSSAALTTSDALSQNSSVAASVWQEIASRQSEERSKAEKDNIRLKLVLEHQIKIAKSLESVLHKKLSTKEIEKCVDHRRLHQPYPPTPGDATDEMLFAELLAGVEQSYAEVNSIFESNRMAQSENSASDAQVRSDGEGGMFLEFFANKVIPFDMHTTGAAVWQHFVYKKERMPYRFYYNKSNKSIDSTEDTVVENFNVELHANSTSGNFRVKQILRRYVEDERVVIVWRAFVDPMMFSDEPVSGVRFYEKGYIVIKRSLAGDNFTLLQQCGITTFMFTNDLMSGDHPKVGAITDFVLSSTAANISASRQMIENVLLEQAMARGSRHAPSLQAIMDVAIVYHLCTTSTWKCAKERGIPHSGALDAPLGMMMQQQTPLSPREQRLPHVPPAASRQQMQQQGSHRQLQLLDLAFEGTPAVVSSREYAYEYEEPLSDRELPRIGSPRPSSARSTRSVHSSRERGYPDDHLTAADGFIHYGQEQQQHYQASVEVGYTHYDELSTQEMSNGAAQDESVLMEASDPELFQAGVEEHAKRLGIDPVMEVDFLWIARESLVAPLPEGWYHVTATETGAPYYYNETTGESRWDHPCDDQFRQIFRELKQKNMYQQSTSRRYDHYNASHVENDNSARQRGDEHTASYYAVNSNYQTMAWQDDVQQGESVDATAISGRPLTSTRYQDNENLSMYSNYPSQQYWSGVGQEQAQVDQNGDYYGAYPYKTANGYEDQVEYDTESVPVAAPQQNGTSARSRSSSSPRSNLAEAQHTERLTQQYLAQLQSIEELKAKDEQLICDLRAQIQELSKKLEQQEEKCQALASDKGKIEDKFGDYRTQLDGYVKKCEDLTEINQTMKRELLAARNRLETQQEEASKAKDDGDEVEKLTAQIRKEQALREDTERKYAEAMKEQSRLSKSFEDSQSTIAALREELAVLRAMGMENDARASASAADASATAAAVATLTKQLSDKEKELRSEKTTSKRLQDQLDELKEGQTKTTEFLQAKLSQQLAQKDEQLETEQQQTAKLQKELQLAVEGRKNIEKQLEEQKLLSTSQLGEAEDQHRALKREHRALERDLKSLQLVSKERDEELTTTKRQIGTLESKLEDQEKLIENARRTGFAEAERASADIIRQAQAEKSRMTELYAQELQTRRKLHNRLMELQGNIRVFCRVRPIQPVEMKSDQAALAIFFRENDHESLELVVGGASDGSGGAGEGGKGGNFIGQKHAFEFDHIFQPTSTQTQVFEQTRALVVSALDGFNVCIFAYGQTGSGKTHTMEGSESDRGVNFRALQELFAIRDDRIAAENFECTMKLSILEVYNETIVDLLDNSNGSSSGSSQQAGVVAKGLDVRMGKTGVYVDNLIEVEVFNENDVIDLMKLGHSHRSVGSHDFNEHSSRSHLVLSIHIETVQRKENRRRVSKLHLIDLAGSERVSKTAASGQRLKEAQNINRSLSALGDVIAALGASSKHVPYRNSKLTFLLQDSLSGNSKVLMFVNVSPVQWNAWETLCSLNFASRCRNVALGQAKQNSLNSSGSGAGPSVGSSALSPTPSSVGANNSMHSSASMSSMGSGTAARSMPRGVPPSFVQKAGGRVTYG